MNEKREIVGGFNAPELAFLLLALLVGTLRYLVGESNLTTIILVKTIQVVSAAIGVLLIAMWLFTDHVDTWANWNMIWTIPALATLVSSKNVARSYIAIALYLLVSPFVWPQYTSLSLWLVAISVFLTLTPQSK
jgi:hypothetical protein